MNPVDGPVLRDIHLPPPPAWWPPAPGWWLLAGICIFCMVGGVLYWRKVLRRRLLHAAILHELDRCIDGAAGDRKALAAGLSQFLRRVALRETPYAAAFHGERWLEYLDAQTSGEEFRRGVGRVLLDAPFRTNVEFDPIALTALVRRWTRQMLATRGAHA